MASGPPLKASLWNPGFAAAYRLILLDILSSWVIGLRFIISVALFPPANFTDALIDFLDFSVSERSFLIFTSYAKPAILILA